MAIQLDAKGCEALQSGLGYSRTHDTECRERITEAIKTTEDGKDRAERASARKAHFEADKPEADSERDQERNSSNRQTPSS